MTDYFTAIIATGLDCDGIFERATALLPELRWRRGESEMQGARTVSGRHELGAVLKFWLYDHQPDRAEVEVSLRGATADADGETAWQQDLVDRLFSQVFPDLGELVEDGRDSAPASGHPVAPLSDALPGGGMVVLDLMEWLPPDGEDGVTWVDGPDRSRLDIEFEPADGGDTKQRSVVFDRALFHLEEPVPGTSTLPGGFSLDGVGIGQVVDLGRTDFLAGWLADSANATAAGSSTMHHYFVMFWEMGVAHHVVAAAVRLD